MGNSFPSVHRTPSPSYVTVRSEAVSALIPAAPAVITALTAPAIKGGDVHKKILFHAEIGVGGRETLAFLLFRDGVQILTATDTWRLLIDPAGTTAGLVGMHWIDTLPGKGEPVYDVRVSGTIGGVSTLINRRLTVSNL